MATDNLTDDQIKEFTEAHALFDRNGTGTISTADVRIAIRALGLDPPEGELERIARDVDTQSAGAASLSFFLGIANKLVGLSDSEEDLVAAFALFDPSESGYLSIDDFRRCITRLGDTLPEREFAEMCKVNGCDGNYVEYRTWIRTLLAQ